MAVLLAGVVLALAAFGDVGTGPAASEPRLTIHVVAEDGRGGTDERVQSLPSGSAYEPDISFLVPAIMGTDAITCVAAVDDPDGYPAVLLRLSPDGRQVLTEVSRRRHVDQLVVVVDRQIMLAPRMLEVPMDGDLLVRGLDASRAAEIVSAIQGVAPLLASGCGG